MPRKEYQYHYIYKIVCIVTQKFYIGMHSTNNLEDGYFGSGKIVRRSLNKYGKESHTKEILEFLESREALKLRERELVNESLLIDPLCMNLQLGGGGGFINEDHAKKFHIGAKITNEKYWTFEKRSNASKKLWKSIEYREKMLNLGKTSFLGKSHSLESKSIMSKRAKERIADKNSQFGTKWISHPINGIKKVKLIDLFDHLQNGWVLGRNKNLL